MGQVLDFYDYVSTRPHVPADEERDGPCAVITLPVIRIERPREPAPKMRNPALDEVKRR